MRCETIPIDMLVEAPWNPNRMEAADEDRLRQSLARYGPVQNLVVRLLEGGKYELIGGNQRLRIYSELGIRTALCIVVQVDGLQARLLSQALNRIGGEDDLGLRAELMKEVLAHLPEEEVLSLLPETTASLNALQALGQGSLAEHLQAWQKAQGARLKHLSFQLTRPQLEVVEKAISEFEALVTPGVGGNPNRRGLALYQMCQTYLENVEGG